MELDKNAVQKAKLNLETGQVAWSSLQRFFAKGIVIHVNQGLDLVDVAHKLSQDDSHSVKRWMKHHKLAPVSDANAKDWLKDDVLLWSIVVRPWVLVQEMKQ